MKKLTAVLAALVVTAVLPAADDPKGNPPDPVVSLVVGQGRGCASPAVVGSARTGGGVVTVSQPAPDTLSVTMTGSAAARGHLCKLSTSDLMFELSQEFEVAFHSPRVKGARLVLWSRAVGLLRNDLHCCDKGGSAAMSESHASVSCGPHQLLSLDLPTRAIGPGQSLSIYERTGPAFVLVSPGKYTLHQRFGISAGHQRSLFSNPASAEFAPDATLDEGWLGKREPFRGADKKELGFHVILRVIADEPEITPKD